MVLFWQWSGRIRKKSNQQNAFSNSSGTHLAAERWAVVTRFRFLLLTVLVAESAARSPAEPPPPAPAPADRVIAAVRASEAQAAALAPGPDVAVRRALAPAERLSGPLARFDATRLDPRLAEHLLSR
jgi:hypothetical protein